jgi:hypothetical protein
MMKYLGDIGHPQVRDLPAALEVELTQIGELVRGLVGPVGECKRGGR